MKINVNVDDETYVHHYVSLFAYGIGLTESEFAVVEELIKYHVELRDKVSEPYLTELILSTDRRTLIKDKLKISDSNFSNILTSIKKKGVIGEEGISTFLLPVDSITFNFKRLGEPVESVDEVVTEEVVREGSSLPALVDEELEETVEDVGIGEDYAFTGEEEPITIMQVDIK